VKHIPLPTQREHNSSVLHIDAVRYEHQVPDPLMLIQLSHVLTYPTWGWASCKAVVRLGAKEECMHGWTHKVLNVIRFCGQKDTEWNRKDFL